MQKINFSTTINAPRDVVWDTMLTDATYREWTRAFNPHGSWYEGSWEQGSTIRFLGPDKDGQLGGMISRVKENRPHEYISVEHLGIIQDGKEDMTSDEVKKWVPAFENYTFIDEGHREMFEETWPKALEKLKALAER